MFRADLTDARTAWIAEAHTPQERTAREQGSFLVYRDDAGRYADFHALRHTFISNLASGGVHPKTAQALARHSTITLTMDRYSHVRRAELAPALDALPDLDLPAAERARATGTAGAETLSVRLRVAGAAERNSVKRGGVTDAIQPAAGTPANQPVLAENPDSVERRGGDSNSRYPCGQTGFRNRRIQPLCHLSGVLGETISAWGKAVKMGGGAELGHHTRTARGGGWELR